MSRDEHNEQDGLGPLQGMVDAVKSEQAPAGAYVAARHNLLEKLDPIQKENLFMSTLKQFTRPGVRWASATGLAIVILAAVLIINPFGRNAAGAYAAVVEQLRKAIVVSFSAQWTQGENNQTQMKIAFREPGLERMDMEYQGVRMIQIIDTEHNKGAFLNPETKTGNETSWSSMPSAEKERIALIKMITKSVKELPKKAEGIVGERTIDGRKVTGFHTGDHTLWIDVDAQQLVEVDHETGPRLVMRDFRLDPPELDESMFSTSLPAGYTAMSAQPLKLDAGNPNETDVVQYLRLSAGMIKGHQFPATTNPMEILALQRQGKLDTESNPKPTKEQVDQFQQAFAQAAQRSMMFVIHLKPENDWHYAGSGVTLGDAKTAVAWYKPSGAAQYRVIWGDLRISDEAAAPK